MNSFLVLVIIALQSTISQALERDVCEVSYIQSRIEVPAKDFNSRHMISAERTDQFIDTREVGFSNEEDGAIIPILKMKGYTLSQTTGGFMMLRKLQVGVTEQTFQQYLFVSFAPAAPIEGVKAYEETKSMNIFEQASKKKQTARVAEFLKSIPHCKTIKDILQRAQAAKQTLAEEMLKQEENEIQEVADSYGGFEGLEALFQTLGISKLDEKYLGDWKPYLKAKQNSQTLESSFSQPDFNEPTFQLKKEHVEKNRAQVNMGCPGGYVPIEFRESELYFQWFCSGGTRFNYCKYHEQNDVMICRQLLNDLENQSYLIFKRYDPFK